MKYICQNCKKQELENTLGETFVCLSCGAEHFLEMSGVFYEEGE